MVGEEAGFEGAWNEEEKEVRTGSRCPALKPG